MLIGFDDQAYESFQRTIDTMRGYGVTITLAGETFDAILVGPDWDAEDGASVLFVRDPEEYDYDLDTAPVDKYESAVVDRIQVS